MDTAIAIGAFTAIFLAATSLGLKLHENSRTRRLIALAQAEAEFQQQRKE